MNFPLEILLFPENGPKILIFTKVNKRVASDPLTVIYLGFITFIGRTWDIIMGLCRKKSQNLSPWPRAAVERSASVYKEQKDWKCKISSSALTSTVLMQGKKIWHTPGVNHWDYTFLLIIFFLWCTMWSLVAVLNFPKNAVFCLCGLIAHAPYGPGTPKKFKKVHKWFIWKVST